MKASSPRFGTFEGQNSSTLVYRTPFLNECDPHTSFSYSAGTVSLGFSDVCEVMSVVSSVLFGSSFFSLSLLSSLLMLLLCAGGTLRHAFLFRQLGTITFISEWNTTTGHTNTRNCTCSSRLPRPTLSLQEDVSI